MRYFLSILLSVLFGLLCGRCTSYQTLTYNEQPKGANLLKIHEGIMSLHAMKLLYKRNGKKVAKITLSEPVMIAMAEQEEKWGYFQFPVIGKTDDGIIIVGWQMKEDSHISDGKRGERVTGPKISKDRGRTWNLADKNYFALGGDYNLKLDSNHLLEIYTPISININSYEVFPKEIGKKGNYTYFLVDSLPNELQGVYLTSYKKGGKTERIHAHLFDPGLLRFAIDSLMPIHWWGNIKQLANGYLLSGIYPTCYQDCYGEIMPSGVSFYKSRDNGQSWEITGKIPYICDKKTGEKSAKCLEEPTFEFLADSTIICVMRSGSVSPMYIARSKDYGRTWTQPEILTPNGVRPSLLLLKNGVLVLVSGRPGIQLRFSFDGTGKTWSEPIEMVPFITGKDNYDIFSSCGYASIVEEGDNSFYLVYSSFREKNKEGEERKTILFRRIVVER